MGPNLRDIWVDSILAASIAFAPSVKLIRTLKKIVLKCEEDLAEVTSCDASPIHIVVAATHGFDVLAYNIGAQGESSPGLDCRFQAVRMAIAVTLVQLSFIGR